MRFNLLGFLYSMYFMKAFFLLAAPTQGGEADLCFQISLFPLCYPSDTFSSF